MVRFPTGPRVSLKWWPAERQRAPAKKKNFLALLFQDFQSGSGAAGIHFVSIVNLSDGSSRVLRYCWCLLHWLLRKSRSCPIGSITPWVSNICWRSICAINGSTAVVGDSCAGPPGPVKPESKNPGGNPNVAAVLPLCPLFPGLDWLPGNPTGDLAKQQG